MSATQQTAEDLEKGSPEGVGEAATEKGKGLNLNVAFVETAALLLVWSMCVTIEGGIRFNNVRPSRDLTEDQFKSGLDREALFVGGLFEVIFGLMGIFLAVATLVFRWFNKRVIKFALLVQFVMGVYVFAAFVIVFPIYRASVKGTPGIIKWAISLGLLTSVHLCYALQGGQFLFMARLISTATGEDFLKGKSGHKMRALFWNGNFGMAGIWTFMFGITALAKKEVMKEMGVFMYPPHVGTAPGYSLATGLAMMICAFLGMLFAIAPLGEAGMRMYYCFCGVVYLNTYLNFNIAQFGTFIDSPSAGIGMHTGLVFFVSFLGPYFLYKSTRKDPEDAL